MSKNLQTINSQNKLALWAGRISECRSSGQNVKTWCRENGVCEQTYYKWQRRLFEMAQAQQAVQFCSRRQGRIKALYWGGNGFVLLYKRLETGNFQWPRKESEARALTPQQYRWLMEALSIVQPKAHRKVSAKDLV